jgi:hypothetical protein
MVEIRMILLIDFRKPRMLNKRMEGDYVPFPSILCEPKMTLLFKIFIFYLFILMNILSIST